MKKLAVFLLAFLLAFGFLAVTDEANAASKSNTETGASETTAKKVTKKAAAKFAKKVVKANSFEALMKKHRCVTIIESTGSIYWFSKDSAYFDSGLYPETVYSDDDRSCFFAGDSPSIFSYYVHDGSKDIKYDITYVSSVLSQTTDVDSVIENTHISLVNDGKTITYIGKLSKEYADFVKALYGWTGTEAVYSKVVVDAKSYELQNWYTYLEGNEDDPDLTFSFYYDGSEPIGLSFMRRMVYRQEDKMVKITVVRDAGKKNESRKEVMIPANSSLLVYVEGTDGVLYTDPEYTTTLEKRDRNSDFTLYLKTADE